MLQKCASARVSHQEMSAQQVCTYLNGFEDHYTSRRCRKLYWMIFERFLNNEAPSPECYKKDESSSTETAVPDVDNENFERDPNISVDESIALDDILGDDELSAEQISRLLYASLTASMLSLHLLLR